MWNNESAVVSTKGTAQCYEDEKNKEGYIQRIISHLNINCGRHKHVTNILPSFVGVLKQIFLRFEKKND